MDEKDFKRIREQLPTPEEIASRLGDDLLEAERRLRRGGKLLGLYILDDAHTPVPIEDTLTWAQWFENDDKRRVASTSINGWNVSTVFLGLDHSHGFSARPILFETLIFSETRKVKAMGKMFRKSMENYGRRYATWDEALAGHEEAVKMIREGGQ
jgi:hypothetical protein